MVATILGYLAIFIYLGFLGGVLRRIINRTNSLPLGNLKGKHEQMTVLLTLPALLLIPLGQAFWDLHTVADSMELSLDAMMGKLALMIAIHFVYTVVGTWLILLADNVFYNGLEHNDEASENRSMLLGMVLLAVVFAGMAYYPFRDYLASMIPSMGVKTFH